MRKFLFLILSTLFWLTSILIASENKTTSTDRNENAKPEQLISQPVEIQLPFNLNGKADHNQRTINCEVERDTWTFTEDFSGNFPGSVWTLKAEGTGNGTGYCWGKTETTPRSGPAAVWCAEVNLAGNPDLTGGTNNYPDNMSAWMIAGPFEVAPFWTLIDLVYYYKGSIQSNHDFTFAGISTNGVTCIGGSYGSSSTNYRKLTVSSSVNFNHVENPRIWICFRFTSDATKNYKGVWIDDIKLSVTSYIYHLANFEATPLAGKTPLAVSFTNICGAPQPNHFAWNFGDGCRLDLREGPGSWSNPVHDYTKPGTYDVTLKAWNQDYEESLTIPGLIYVDSVLEYCDLKLVDWGRYYRKSGWDKAIDHDILGLECTVAAKANDAWAIFVTSDKSDRLISKIRLLTDMVYRRDYRTNCAKDVRISLSLTGKFTGEESVFQYTCTGKHGDWDEIPIAVDDAPVRAKYIKVEILSARGEGAKYRELVEMQVLGTPAPVSKENPEIQTATTTTIPVDFDLSQNYPNPFNPVTTIQFSLAETAEVCLSVYNLQGQQVKTLVSSEWLAAGVQTRIWEARDESGNPVAGGIYIYKLTATSQSRRIELTQKMLLLK